MTNKELIDKIREEILHLKMKELQRTNGINTGADVYLSSYAVLSILSNALTEESEDEKIRKELIFFLKEEIPQCSIKEHANKLKEFVSYLEKQKYDRMKPIYDARESFESALEKAWNDYHNGYENVDKLEDDYVECAHAKGFREGYLFGIEKQKEQKPAEKQDYSGLNDLERAIHRGFLSAGVENVPVTIIKETAKECLAQMKPAWSEEDEKLLNYAISMTDDAQVERFLKSLRPQPKQEWSEDDKGILLSVKCVIDEVWHSKNNTTDCPANELEEMWHWLDTLWQRVEYPQPSWKPSEEQMEALMLAIEGKCPPTSYMSRRLEDLYEQLKKL